MGRRKGALTVTLCICAQLLLGQLVHLRPAPCQPRKRAEQQQTGPQKAPGAALHLGREQNKMANELVGWGEKQPASLPSKAVVSGQRRHQFCPLWLKTGRHPVLLLLPAGCIAAMSRDMHKHSQWLRCKDQTQKRDPPAAFPTTLLVALKTVHRSTLLLHLPFCGFWALERLARLLPRLQISTCSLPHSFRGQNHPSATKTRRGPAAPGWKLLPD